jgi:iron complex outermembrane receptor protein
MRTSFLVLSCLFVVNTALCQTDSTQLLNPVMVKAFAHEKPLVLLPASVALINATQLNRFSNTSFLPALNCLPGVRMEERSPGSFRLAIRGSSLRSPFGIRNTKFYWNGLPLTDGGGNTYLNLLDFNAVGQMEVIKGPSGSLYGAGMGGVLLLTSSNPTTNEVHLTASAGSYGLQRYQLSATAVQDKVSARISHAYQQADGYRQHSALNRYSLNLELQAQINKKLLVRSSHFLTDLQYQTPGGLTLQQYEQNPRQARPSAGSILGAVEQQASVYNTTFYSGLLCDIQWNSQWNTQLGLFNSSTDFKNPTLSNFEKRTESNWGGRMVNQFVMGEAHESSFTFGGEFVSFLSPIQNFENRQGVAGNLLFSDVLQSTLGLVFAQAELKLHKTLSASVGASGNFVLYDFNRTSSPTVQQQRTMDPVFVPRIALLKSITKNTSVYATLSKGFSPPTLAEVRPSTNTFNDSLRAETGINYELGARGFFLKNFSFDVALYSLQLKETIVVQRQINGSDFFVNAGGTSQLGAEVMLGYDKPLSGSIVSFIKIWGSYTHNAFTFNRYVKNSQDFSYNKLTGVAPHVVTAGADFKTKVGLYLNIVTTYVDSLPLNDANTDWASGYYLIGGRLGWSSTFKNSPFDFWVGIDNATNETYSLGNDLNASNKRYFNAAANRNYYVGIQFKLTSDARKQ